MWYVRNLHEFCAPGAPPGGKSEIGHCGKCGACLRGELMGDWGLPLCTGYTDYGVRCTQAATTTVGPETIPVCQAHADHVAKARAKRDQVKKEK